MSSPARKILVVDDDRDVREALSEVLADAGFSIVQAPDGRAALNWLLGHKGERVLVILDLMMPVMDGASFLDQKSRDPALSGVPVVVLTAGNSPLELLLQQKADACLRKPISLLALLAVIDGLANRPGEG